MRGGRGRHISLRGVADFSIFSPKTLTPRQITGIGRFIGDTQAPAPQYNYVMPMIVILFTLLPASAGYLFRTQHVGRFCFSRSSAPALSRAIFHNDERAPPMSPSTAVSSIMCSRCVPIGHPPPPPPANHPDTLASPGDPLILIFKSNCDRIRLLSFFCPFYGRAAPSAGRMVLVKHRIRNIGQLTFQ